MSFLFPDTPTPPNPLQTSAAQTGTNVSTAIANANLGSVNQVTPQGSLSYDITGNYGWSDPVTGASYNVPRFTATQTLSPYGQLTNEQSESTKYRLALLGNDQAARLLTQFQNPLNIAGAPQFGNPNNLAYAPQAQNQFGDTGDPQFGFGAAGDVSRSFGAAPDVQSTYGQGTDFGAERNRIESGLMQRLDPSLSQERNKYEQQLADQGIRYGSPAYENAMRNYSMQANDARLGVIGQAGSEQQRLEAMAAARGEFTNKAQQQIYEQALGRGQFGNEAQQQFYQQLLGRGTFANQAQQQAFGQEASRGTFANAALAQNFQQAQSAFNANNAARQQYLNEQFALRNQPINEISALLSGSQVAQPNFLSTNMPSIPTTDVAGILNKNFDQQMAATNQQSNNINNIIGGLFGFAGNVARSDRNVKQDINQVGSILAADPEGERSALPIYSYKYRDDPRQQQRVGPMAQDVEKIDKKAVRKIGGVKHIDVPRLGEILKAA